MLDLAVHLPAGVMTWDAEARIAFVRFHRETRPLAGDATILSDALQEWVGAEPKPFALLIDAKNVIGVDSAFRATWGKFFRSHRERSCLVFFNVGPIVRIAAEMFRIGIGVQVKAFADEAGARCWLRQRGVCT